MHSSSTSHNEQHLLSILIPLLIRLSFVGILLRITLQAKCWADGRALIDQKQQHMFESSSPMLSYNIL